METVRQQLAEFNEAIAGYFIKACRKRKKHSKQAEADYSEATSQYNEFNLNVTRQQSKINALKQELEFKNNQLNDLKEQIEE